MDMDSKSAIRRLLKDRVAALAATERASKSSVACSWITQTAEFASAEVVMLYLSLPDEVDTASLALRCWQAGKTVVVPKVAWGQRRMLPVEISCLQTGVTRNGGGPGGSVPEPVAGKPVPLDLIDLVIVPGTGVHAVRQPHRPGDGLLRPLPDPSPILSDAPAVWGSKPRCWKRCPRLITMFRSVCW